MRQGRRIIPYLRRNRRTGHGRQELSRERRSLRRNLRTITTISRNNLLRILKSHIGYIARSRHTRERLRRNSSRTRTRRTIIRTSLLMPSRRQSRRQNMQCRRSQRNSRRTRITTQMIRTKRQMTNRHASSRKRRSHSRDRSCQIRRMLKRAFLVARRNRMINRTPTLKLNQANLQTRQTSSSPSRQTSRSSNRRNLGSPNSSALPR